MANNSFLINQDSGEKTWLTPKWIIDALGHFDTDPCTPEGMPWKTADRMYTKKDDGTTAPWVGRVWLNPPYGKEAWPFLERMAHYEGGGIALIFVRTDARQWHEWVFPYAHAVLFMRGRVNFCAADGTEGSQSAPIGSALIAYSKEDAEILLKSGIKGTYMPLKGVTYIQGNKKGKTTR